MSREVPVAPVTQGRSRRSLTVATFQLTEGTYASGETLPRHAHASAATTIILAGSVTEIFDRRRYWCGPWSVLTKPAGEPHSDKYGASGATCLFIEMTSEWLARVRLSSDIFERVSFLPPAAATPVAQRLYRETRAMDLASPLAIEGLMLEMLAALVRWPDGPRAERIAGPLWLRRAVELIHDRFDSPLRVTDIAAEAGVHPVSLARVFRERYAQSPAEYVRDVRLAWARDALRRSSDSIAEIATAAGFSDQSHFTRVFHRRFGLAPSRYRKHRGFTPY